MSSPEIEKDASSIEQWSVIKIIDVHSEIGFEMYSRRRNNWLREKGNWYMKETIVELIAHKKRQDKENIMNFSRFILQLTFRNFGPISLIFLVVNCSILDWFRNIK